MRGQRRWRAANKMKVEVMGVLNRQGEETYSHSEQILLQKGDERATAGRREGHEVGEARAFV